MYWYLIDSNNTVQNNIAYDGITPYNPPKDLIIKSSTNIYNIGDTFNN